MPARDRASRPELDKPAEAVQPKPSPALPAPETLARSSAPQVLRFATAFGNRATAQALQRHPVADAAAVAKGSPSGPLAKLRDELDDTFVDEGDCLMWLGQLGPGERELVAKDNTMMRQMVDAFNVKEMLQAVEHLHMPIAWQLYWIDQAGDTEDIGQVAFARLLNSATADQFDQLVKSGDQVREVISYKGDVLSLAPVMADPARAAGWLGNAAYADWVLKRTGAPVLVNWMGAHAAPATAIAALKKADRWNALLDKLRGGGPAGLEREGLFKLFMASTEADDRRRLYELRFGRRAQGTFDWIADGEAEWKRQEGFAGAGRTRDDVQKEIAAGGPKTAKDAAAADDKGPLAKLRDELDDTFVDEELCLRLLGELSDRELFLVGEDSTMLDQMASAFDDGEMRQALNRLRYLPLKAALKFVSDSGEMKGLDASMYQMLVNRATSQEIAEAVGWDKTLGVLKRGSQVNPLAMPPLVADDAKMAHIIGTYSSFTTWVLDFKGSDDAGAPGYVRYLAAHSPLQTFMALKTAGRMDDVIGALPTGSSLAARDKIAMRTIHHALTDVPTKKALLMKRYDLKRIGPDTDATYAPAAGTDFEAPVLDRIWDLLELLPPADVADNKWLDEITRRSNPDAPDPQGVTPDNRIAIGYDPTQMARPETGTFTDPADPMRTTNMFDSTVIHEMGHASDAQYGWTKKGGPFDTNDDLGAWADHAQDTDALVDRWATDLSLPTTLPVAAELADAVKALKSAMAGKKTNAEDGFKAMATAGGGPAYGTAGDKWQPLWTKISAHTIVQACQMSQSTNNPWRTAPPDINGRTYHDTGYDYWASYKTATRTGGKLSFYQFRDKRDFFAETYATYYLTAPADPGSLVKTWNNKVYEWFRDNVDRGHSAKPGP